MAISEQPFANSPTGDVNRIRRITFMVGPTKTSAYVVHPTGPLSRYDRARDDSTDPQNRQVAPRDRYITEETS